METIRNSNNIIVTNQTVQIVTNQYRSFEDEIFFLLFHHNILNVKIISVRFFFSLRH